MSDVSFSAGKEEPAQGRRSPGKADPLTDAELRDRLTLKPKAQPTRVLAVVLWIVLLLICPVGIAVLGVVHQNDAPPGDPFPWRRPWAYYALQPLFLCQIVVSPVAAVAALRIFRDWTVRVTAWLGILVLLMLTAILATAASTSILLPAGSS